MKLKDLLEAPLADISFHGDESASNFSETDWKLMKKFAVEKTYHKKLEKLPFDLYVYVIGHAGLAHIGKRFPEGEIFLDGSYSHSVDELPAEIERLLQRHMGSNAFKNVFSAIEHNMQKNKSAIHFVLGDNYAGENSDQIGPTPWILVHRLMHTARNVDLGRFFLSWYEIMKEIDVHYRPNTKEFIKAIGQIFNVRSMKQGKTSNYGESSAEIMTKYLVTGNLDINEEFLADFEQKSGKELGERLRELAAQMQTRVTEHADLQVAKMRNRIFYI